MHRLLALAVPILLVAACGSGSSGGSSGNGGSQASTTPAPSASAASGGQEVTVHETEFKLDPSTVSVKAGSVTFDLVDDGQAPHDLHIAPKGSASEIGASSRISPGGKSSFTVTLQPGVYDMWCGVPGHRQAGMQGTVTVS